MTTEHPQVSIVIPAFNEEKYLVRTLKSIQRNNTQIPFEVIGVDNASTDATRKIFESFGVRVISEPRKGLSKARAAGIRAALGEIIIQVDADSIVPRHFIEGHCKIYEDPQVIAVSGYSRITGVHPLTFLWCMGSKYFRRTLGQNREVLYDSSSNISYRKKNVLEIIHEYERHIFRLEDRKMLKLLMTQGIVVDAPGVVDTKLSGRKYETLIQSIRLISESVGRKILWRYEKWFPENLILRDVR